MNDKCKYCDYVSKCSRKCEYDSILCQIQRSFPKVVDKSYEQLQQENQQLKEKYLKLERQQKEFINFLEDNWKQTQDIWYIKILQKYKEIIGD